MWIIFLHHHIHKLQTFRNGRFLMAQSVVCILLLNSVQCRCVICAVDIEEIKRLGKRFKKLDLDKSGSLSVDEFMSLPELQQNPLVQRVIDIFDTDGNGEVDFKGKSLLF